MGAGRILGLAIAGLVTHKVIKDSEVIKKMKEIMGDVDVSENQKLIKEETTNIF